MPWASAFPARHTYRADVDKSLRIIADHSRSVTFMIADGILPSNEGRGYVLRRLLRRAIQKAHTVGIEGPFLNEYVDEIVKLMGDGIPKSSRTRARRRVILSEEERFGATLARAGLSGRGPERSRAMCFPARWRLLHDTYGFPVEVTVEIAGTAGHDVDMDGFTACMEDQKARARANAKGDAWGSFNDVWVELSDKKSLRPSSMAMTTM